MTNKTVSEASGSLLSCWETKDTASHEVERRLEKAAQEVMKTKEEPLDVTEEVSQRLVAGYLRMWPQSGHSGAACSTRTTQHGGQNADTEAALGKCRNYSVFFCEPEKQDYFLSRVGERIKVR